MAALLKLHNRRQIKLNLILPGLVALVLSWFVLVDETRVALAQTPVPPVTSPVSVPVQLQKGSGSIQGQLVWGTTSAGAANPVAGQIITLEFVNTVTSASGQADVNQEPASGEVARATSDEKGNFAFQNLSTSPDYSYYVSTSYRGVPYYVQKEIKLTAGQPAQSVELKVYETTADRSVVSIVGTSLVLPQVDEVSGQIMVMEMYSILNKSDRTFTGQVLAAPPSPSPAVSQAATPGPAEPDTAGPGRSTTLRFYLPPGATGITPASGIVPGDIVETTDGIEIKTPVLPGESQLVFSYRLAYQGEFFSFNKRLAYDTPSLRFFTPVAGPKATSRQLAAGPTMQMGQQQLNTLSGQNFKADNQVRVELSNLPLPPSKGAVATRDIILKSGAILAGLAGFVFLFFYIRRQSKRNQAVAAPDNLAVGQASLAGEKPDLAGKKQQLLYNLARLDYRFEKGEFKGSEKDYYNQRAAWKGGLIEMWASPETELEDSGPDPDPDPAGTKPAEALQTSFSPAATNQPAARNE